MAEKVSLWSTCAALIGSGAHPSALLCLSPASESALSCWLPASHTSVLTPHQQRHAFPQATRHFTEQTTTQPLTEERERQSQRREKPAFLFDSALFNTPRSSFRASAKLFIPSAIGKGYHSLLQNQLHKKSHGS